MARYWYRFFALIAIVAGLLAPAGVYAQRDREGRPNLPDEQTTGTEHFLIHYTFEGEDAASPDDADSNGTADYVEAMAAALEHSWQKEIVEMGWSVPPDDGGIGGDDRLDVYLENLMDDDIAGYTESGGGYVGDNPNTPELEQDASFSFLSIDNDFAEIDPADGESALELMQVTVAHEFNHVLQAGYDGYDEQIWLYEATAVWMEGQVYPDIPDRLFYLPDLANNPEKCLAHRDQWYASWLYMQYLSEQYGRDIVRGMWENSREVDSYQAIDEVLSPYGTSAIGSGRDFAVANLLRAYEEGQIYPTVHQGGVIDGEGTFAPGEPVETLGTTYILLNGSSTVTVEFPGRRAMSARVVGIRGADADVYEFSDDQTVIDLGGYDHTYIVVHADSLSGDGECDQIDFAVSVGPAQGDPTPVAATWPAGNFGVLSEESSSSGRQPPSNRQPYRGSSEQEPSTSAAQSPEDLRPGFSTIIPDPPRGYYFDYAYVMTERDFGTGAPFYTPDSEQSANYDYLNDDGNWLSVSESPTDFDSLQDWADDIAYSPDSEPEVIDGVKVLLVDSARGKHSQVSAIFIYHGLFIVIDGDGSIDDVTEMAQGIIEKDKAGIRPNLQGGTQTGAPVIETATPEPSTLPPTQADDTTVLILAALTACGLGICLAGIGVVAVVMLTRRKKT